MTQFQENNLPATARGPTSTTAVDWHFKVKDIEYNVSLTKNYCLTVSMQKISWIHKLTFKKQQNLESYELNGHGHFLPCQPINYGNNFLLSWDSISMQNISSFHLFILEIQSISESHDQIGHAHPKTFWPDFNLCELASTWKKVRLFLWLVLEIQLIKKSCNLNGWVFWPISQELHFYKYKICTGT